METQEKFKFWDFDKRVHYFSDKLEQISCTDLNKCKNECELRMWHKLQNPKKFEKRDYLYLGEIYHSTLEYYYWNKAIGQELTWKPLSVKFEQLWENGKNVAIFDKLEESKAKKMCSDYLQKFYNERIKILTPLNQQSMELFMKFKIHNKAGRSIIITMKIDFLDKSLTCIDFKTGRVWDLRHWQNESQGYLYPCGLKANGIDCKGFQYDIVNNKELAVWDIPRDPKITNDWLAYSLSLQESFENPESLLRAKNSDICKSRCEWNDICSDKLI